MTDKAKLKKQEADALAAPVERAEDLGRASGPATQETRLWLKSLEYVVESILSQQGSDQARFFVDRLHERLRQAGIQVPTPTTTPYVNTIPASKEPVYPGDWRIETRIKSMIRWNAMAMVVNANRKHDGLGGHISTYASCATLYEVAYNHFFRGGDDGQPADLVYF
ncbi:MAG: pyruvate dehydrogenase (acetyl-transferring), homodimeric type, partial [Verrucomicrobia bacterium]